MDRRHIPFVWEDCAAKFLLQRSLVPLAPGPHGVQNGHPQTRVIDMMLLDDKGVYFLTAKGKTFYAQLMEQGYIALSAAKGKVSVSLPCVIISSATVNKKVATHRKIQYNGK